MKKLKAKITSKPLFLAGLLGFVFVAVFYLNYTRLKPAERRGLASKSDLALEKDLNKALRKRILAGLGDDASLSKVATSKQQFLFGKLDGSYQLFELDGKPLRLELREGEKPYKIKDLKSFAKSFSDAVFPGYKKIKVDDVVRGVAFQAGQFVVEFESISLLLDLRLQNQDELDSITIHTRSN